MRWEPVSGALPEEGEHVLLFHRDGTQWVGYRGVERPGFEDSFRPYSYFIDRAENEMWEWEDITHWRPLPEPPQDNVEAK